MTDIQVVTTWDEHGPRLGLGFPFTPPVPPPEVVRDNRGFVRVRRADGTYGWAPFGDIEWEAPPLTPVQKACDNLVGEVMAQLEELSRETLSHITGLPAERVNGAVQEVDRFRQRLHAALQLAIENDQDEPECCCDTNPGECPVHPDDELTTILDEIEDTLTRAESDPQVAHRLGQEVHMKLRQLQKNVGVGHPLNERLQQLTDRVLTQVFYFDPRPRPT